MAVAVEIPKLGDPTLEECLISKWLKEEGQAVVAGKAVVEIETDKTSFEVEAPLNGPVLARFFNQGALVPVFTKLFVIGNPGESSEEFRPQVEGASGAGRAVRSEEPSEQSAHPEPVARAGADAAVASSSAAWSPRARRFAEEHNFYPVRRLRPRRSRS